MAGSCWRDAPTMPPRPCHIRHRHPRMSAFALTREVLAVFGEPRRMGRRLCASFRANGSRECAPDDRLREAIHDAKRDGLLRRVAPRTYQAATNSVAPKRRFVEAIQSDLPCPVPLRKIFRFIHRANQNYKPRYLVPREGRWPSSRTLGRDA